MDESHNSDNPHKKKEIEKIQVILGYKEELLKGLNTFMSFTLSLTNSAVIPSLFIQLQFGFMTGGPVVMLWGWIIVGLFTICVSLSMAEICSTFPAAGGMYYWSGAMSPKKWAPVISYVVGWIYFLGNIAMSTSFAYWLPTVLSGVQSLATGNSWSDGLIVSVCIAILAIWAAKGLLRIDYQGYLHDIAGIFTIVAGLAMVIVIFIKAPTLSSTSFVFTAFNNTTGFESSWYVCYIGMLFSTYSFVGYEAAGTCAEETVDSTTSAPKGIVYNVIASYFFGFLTIIAFLYGCQEDIDYILNGDGDATVNLFSLIFNSKSKGVIFMVMLVFMSTFLTAFTCITVASRIVFAMVRDGAIPYSRYFYYVNPSRKSPDRIIILLFVLESLLCLMPLISSTAFTAINQLATICLQITYLVPILLRLTVAKDTFKQGDFNLGDYSIPVGWCAAIFLIVSSISLLLPTELAVNGITAGNFNYTPVLLIGVLIFAAIYWNLPRPYGAKHFFQGPKRPDIILSHEETHITLFQHTNYDAVKQQIQ